MSVLNNAITSVREINRLQNYGITPDIQLLQKQIAARFPMVLKVFRSVDAEINAKKQHKGYYLVKRPHKTRGFLFYVRYVHKGKTIPSMWNTGTNIKEAADIFAMENKKRIIEEYLARTDNRLFTILENYYKKDAKHFIRSGG
jgi:hypothetical protein